MLPSHVIDIAGAFVGAAVRLDRGYRFIATDMKLDDLDGSIWPTLADIQRLARRLYLSGHSTLPAQTRSTKGTTNVTPATPRPDQGRKRNRARHTGGPNLCRRQNCSDRLA